MLFDVLFIADWKQIGEFRQHVTDRNNNNKNKKRVNYDYKVGNKILIRKDGILCIADFIWKKEPWTGTTLHTNGTIRFNAEPNRKELISGE
jgi:hypothetical protein